jgi:peptide/nickel transport system substrate-binding protein
MNNPGLNIPNNCDKSLEANPCSRRYLDISFVFLFILIILLALGGCTAIGRIQASSENPPGQLQINETSQAVVTSTSAQSSQSSPAPAFASPTPTVQVEPFEPITASAPSCDYGGVFKAIQAFDELTVRFALCRPEPAFLAKIAFPSFAIQPKEWLEQTGGGGQGSLLLQKPIGTGPYALSEWLPGEHLSLNAFEGYWGEKAKTQQLVFRWDRDASQRLLELQTATVDGIDNVNSTDLEIVQSDPNLELVLRPPLNVVYMGMNNELPPFDDERVRQAIGMGIDRQRLVSEAFPAGYQVADYFSPCAIPNACVGDRWYDFDPLRAKELLAEAGYGSGFRSQLFFRDVVRGYLPLPEEVAENIKSQLWENLRIDVKIRAQDSQTFDSAVDSGSLDGLYLLGWGADYPDVSNFLDVHFGAKATLQFGHKFDDIVLALDEGANLAGDSARMPFYQAANNAIRQHVPMIPIAHGGWATQDGLAVAYKSNVQGAHASPLNLENFSLMAVLGQDTFTWMQKAEPFSLYCADETDPESLRACAQITESLYRYRAGSAVVEPALAEICQPNDSLDVWTCTLRPGVHFHDGSILDANDVVISLLVQWDASNPLHTGNTGEFAYFRNFWEEFLNAPGR